MSYKIIPASIQDLGSLHRVEHACFPRDAWSVFDLIAVLTWPEVVHLKAVADGQMVGFIAGDPRPSQGLAWIATLGVLPEYRRQGIGRMLLRECEVRLAQPCIRLCVRISNDHAIHMYTQEGYHSVDTWQEYYNDKESALVMEKTRLV